MAVKTEAMATKAPENILYNKLPPSAEDEWGDFKVSVYGIV
ncbi:MAG: hypothetical protein ACLTZI_14790 [[Eubacterium] siraeum]